MKIPVAVTILLAIAALAATLGPGDALELRPGGEPWRIVTCHFTHWTYEQLAWDGLAFTALALACARRNRGAFHATLLASALLVPLAVLRFAPEVHAYRGLSGIASALFGLLLVPPTRESRLYAMSSAIVTVAFFGKLGFELVTGGTVFVQDMGAGVVPVPVAHLAGALIGVTVGVLYRSVRMTTSPAGVPRGGEVEVPRIRVDDLIGW
jgi:rhomboid family GlyGly-CTERM serine protease